MKPSLARDIVSVSDFRKKTSAYLHEIRLRKRLVVLTQNGHSAAIVLNPEEFERVQDERDLFKAIAQGEREIEQGKGIPHKEVFKNLYRQLK